MIRLEASRRLKACRGRRQTGGRSSFACSFVSFQWISKFLDILKSSDFFVHDFFGMRDCSRQIIDCSRPRTGMNYISA